MWSESKESEKDAAARPTTSDPTNKTGWIAYYSTDASGSGWHTPTYIYAPWASEDKAEDVHGWIIDTRETWMHHANRAHLCVHYGVKPPVEVIEKQRDEYVKMANRHLALADELNKYLQENV
ncbi:hypothetical protein DLP3_114 [Stenotrophomonas phage vB_SmaS_DLP_3]|nr:hypothetical protein DLP3_114 [Stenotrophomonas phage vB_SmaS_DLP_3]